MEGPTPFGAGVVLVQEEHEQNGDDAFHLLVAQPELQCQFEHWRFLQMIDWQSAPQSS